MEEYHGVRSIYGRYCSIDVSDATVKSFAVSLELYACVEFCVLMIKLHFQLDRGLR